MPLFGKKGSKARDFISGPVGQQAMAAVSRMIPGDPYGFYRAEQAQQARAQAEQAQREQLGTAFTDLLGQMRGPDTMTPQVNELIGGANMRAGGNVLPMQTPRRAGLDYSDPATQEAFARYIMAGGNAQLPQGIAETMQPPKMQTFNTRSGVVGVNPETGEVEELYQDPYAEALAQKQIEATDALADQRRSGGQAALINANRPRSTGRAPAPVATGTGKVGPWAKYGGQ